MSMMDMQYWSPPDLKGTLQDLRDININVTQWEPVIGLVQFPVVAGAPDTIVVQAKTALLDKLGESNNGGIALTNADATFFGGKVPNGQIILLQSLGLSIWGNGLTAQDVNTLVGTMSVIMQLRQRPIEMGAVADWPSIDGIASAPNNGFEIVGEVPFEPILLEPLDDLTLTISTTQVSDVSGPNVNPQIRIRFAATRFNSQRVLGLS